MKTKEKVIGRLIILSIFIFMVYYFYADIRGKFISIRSKKNMQTNNIIMNFQDKLRVADFYKEFPSYPFDRKQKVDVNKESEILENIDKLEEDVKKVPNSSNESKENLNTENKRYYLQIATYSSNENAKKIIEKLSKFKAIIETTTVKNKKYYRVIIPHIDTREKALRIGKDVKKVLGNKENPLVRVRY